MATIKYLQLSITYYHPCSASDSHASYTSRCPLLQQPDKLAHVDTPMPIHRENNTYHGTPCTISEIAVVAVLKLRQLKNSENVINL